MKQVLSVFDLSVNDCRRKITFCQKPCQRTTNKNFIGKAENTKVQFFWLSVDNQRRIVRRYCDKIITDILSAIHQQ